MRDDDGNPGNFFIGVGNALLLTAAAICVSAAFGGVFFDGDDAAVIARLEADAAARKALKPCDITIAQYGPGERWLNPPPSSCGGAAGAVPDHVLSMPVASK